MRAKAHLITEIRGKFFLYEEETADLEPCLKIDCCWRQHVTVVTSIFNISFQTIHVLFAVDTTNQSRRSNKKQNALLKILPSLTN